MPRKPDLPKRVKVGHITYTLKRTKNCTDRGTPVWGFHRPSTKELEVEDLPNLVHEAEVVLHELFHALFDTYEIEHACKINDETEEFMVSTLSKGVITLLVDNPKLTTYLIKAIQQKDKP